MFCKLLSDFAMEYRTTYDKVQAKRERIKHEKERVKKRGKLIVSGSHTLTPHTNEHIRMGSTYH